MKTVACILLAVFVASGRPVKHYSLSEIVEQNKRTIDSNRHQIQIREMLAAVRGIDTTTKDGLR